MALIALAADKGSPGVTTTALALAAVWPRPVLLAECDPAGGDLVFRFPGVNGESLDPRRGLLSLAVAARRGGQPDQVWEHTQKLHGGLDILTGVTNSEQGSGLHLLWGPLGKLLASLGQADVIADCGRIGTDGPHYDLLAEATELLLITRSSFGEVVRLRDRVPAVIAAFEKRGRRGFRPAVAVRADSKDLRNTIGEVGQVVGTPAGADVIGGIADDPKAAAGLAGDWSGKLDKTLLIRTVREIAGPLSAGLPEVGGATAAYDAPYEEQQRALPPPHPGQHSAPPPYPPDPRGQQYAGQDWRTSRG